MYFNFIYATGTNMVTVYEDEYKGREGGRGAAHFSLCASKKIRPAGTHGGFVVNRQARGYLNN